MATRLHIASRIMLSCLVLMFSKARECLEIGVLLPSTSSRSGNLTLRTIQLAIEKVKASQRLSIKDVDVIYRNTSCSTKQALGVSVDLLKSNHNVTLLLGPACLEPIETVALLASYSNIPIVTWIPVNDLVLSRSRENIAISTMGSHEDTVKAIGGLLKHYSWKNVVAFGETCEISRTFISTMEKMSTAMNITIQKMQNFQTLSRRDMAAALKTAKPLTKVFVMSLRLGYLSALMEEAQRQGMTSGDFVFINWSPSGTVYNSVTYLTGVPDLATITSGVLLQLVNYVIHDDIHHKFQDSVIPKLPFVVVVVVVVVVVTGFYMGKLRLKRTKQMWLLDNAEVKIKNTRVNYSTQPRKNLIRMETRGTLGFGSCTSLDRNMLFTPIGNYRGSVVAVKTMQHRAIKLTPEIVADLTVLKELQHDNLNQFVGCSMSPGNTYVLFKYCSKGSLQDVLENDDINIDWMFKISFATDLSKGMEYIHKSILRSHGNLKSSNCVIDSRWVLKVTDYGAVTSQLQEPDDEIREHEYYNKLLWTAPELLRLEKRPAKGTQQGDVYSFGIILSEIMLRCGAYYYNNISSKEIVTRVRNGEDPPYRPKVYDDGDVMDKPMRLMASCWLENPDSRPTFNQIKKSVIDLNGGKKTSILDNMIQLLEAYSNNLEDLVAERTNELAQEKRKTDRLLYQMLPPSVANQLKGGLSVVPESYEDVSIFFSDIVGFTSIAGKSQPLDVVELLNDLYTTFDGIISKHDVYKVETIGDAYMCASGLPRRNGKRHSGEIANMALDLISAVTSFRIKHMPEDKLHLRVGLHTGSCAAGVVGRIMPRYCLFGDTVNMASRMESTSKALHIHLSTPMNESLDALNWGFITAERGFIPIKGKGIHKTYWLIGKNGFDKPLPETMLSLLLDVSAEEAKATSTSTHSLNVDGMYSAVLRKASVSMSNLSDISCTSTAEASGADDFFPDVHGDSSRERLCVPNLPPNSREHSTGGDVEDVGSQFQFDDADDVSLMNDQTAGPEVVFADDSKPSTIPTIHIS
ncbi:atrial natriuretic peptide receptor 2-like [Gigantopelta aegis]|uniref:atrial natriuretic peptide receptor 2-like n=1 Tax=Gigantopelta aegis TaxID=1735272 RepID=UPI001B889D61|nr:atrial natriuretic peptide receptor 2-like [Gigantopelta aegis]